MLDAAIPSEAFDATLQDETTAVRREFGSRTDEPIILYTKDVMEKDGILHLPLYMAPLL